MAEAKKVKLIAGPNPIWTGTERVEPGATFEVTEAQAKHLLRKGAAKEAKDEGEVKEAKAKGQGKAQEGKTGDAGGGE